MHADDKPRFFALLVGVAELYRRTFSETALALYWAALADYPWERIEQAIAAHLRHPDTGAYCPNPADIVRQLAGGSASDRAAVAWAKVERELRRVGAYASVVFDDPLIMRSVAALGGWPALCHAALDELPFRAKDFKALYAAYAVAPAAAHPRALLGLAEQHNRVNDLPVAPPVLLGGDPAAALAVYRTGQDLDALAPPHRPTAADWPRLAGPAEPGAVPVAALSASPPALPVGDVSAPATVTGPTHPTQAAVDAGLRSSAPRPPAPPSLSPAEQDRLLAAARAHYPARPEDAAPVWTPPVEEPVEARAP